jgi:hypothetical protein
VTGQPEPVLAARQRRDPEVSDLRLSALQVSALQVSAGPASISENRLGQLDGAGGQYRGAAGQPCQFRR